MDAQFSETQNMTGDVRGIKIPVKWDQIKHDGPLPEKFYRFRSITPDSIDRLINFEILEEGIFLSGLKDLNDPNEGRFLIKFDGNATQIYQYWIKLLRKAWPNELPVRISQEAKRRRNLILQNNLVPPDEVIEYIIKVMGITVRAACFAIDWSNSAMWAHYAKFTGSAGENIDHGGICIEYQCDDSWRNINLHPIVYSNDIPIINSLKVHKNELELVKTSYTKTLEWNYENEWRITCVLKSPTNDQMDLITNPKIHSKIADASKIYVERSIISIIFGLNATNETILKFKNDILRKKPNFKFRKITRNARSLKLELIDL